MEDKKSLLENPNRVNYSDISLKEIEEAVADMFYNRLPIIENSYPIISYHEWTEEDGGKRSAWKIKSKNGTIMTGDGGALIFFKNLYKA